MSNLKVGSKVQLLVGTDGFAKGQIVELYKLCKDGYHLFKGDNSMYLNCNGASGGFLAPHKYKVLPRTQAHPHADIMLKYAHIAHYDDKPWEQFEYLQSDGAWVTKNNSSPFFEDSEYRLKPQPHVVQAGQTWVSSGSGQEVQVLRKPYPSEGGCGVVKTWVIGVVLDEQLNLVASVVILELDLIKHFKRKE